MTLVIFLTIGLLAAVIIFVWPKLGSMMIWPILFMYPHNWWFYRGFLPLNIGADDLFCVLLFLVVVARRNLWRGVPVRAGYAFWVITVFTLVSIVATLAGSFETSAGDVRAEAIKAMLKPLVFWALFYGILHCVDNTRDLKIQFTLFAVSAACGAALVILQNFFPQELNIFVLPRAYVEVGGFTRESRGAGAFLNPNAAACVLGSSVLMSITALRLQRGALLKAFLYAVIVVLLVGVMYTRSRSGLIALGICILLMAFIGRGKAVALIVILGAIVVAVVFPAARELYSERFARAYAVETGMLGHNVVGRLEMWRVYLTESSASDYLFGQGTTAAVAKYGMESHNAYISLLTVYGVAGAIWAAFALTGFVRRVRSSLRSPDAVVRTVAAGSQWGLLFWGIYAFAADAISAPYSRFLLFYVVVLADRAYAFARQPFADVFRGASGVRADAGGR